MVVRFMMRIPRYRLVLLTVFAAAFLFFITQTGLLPGRSGRPAPAKSFTLLDTLISLIRNDYLEERDPVQTAEGASRGIVNSLDPLSSYLPKDLTARSLARTFKETDPGLVVFKKYGSFPQVVGILPGSPADKADVKLGDLVSAIDHRNTLSMSMREVTLLLGGTDEKPVHVKLLRGNESHELSLPRALLFTRPYEFSRAPGRPDILAIREFLPGLSAGIRGDVLPSLKARKRPFVLDLRNCAGGEIESAREFANLFLQAANVGAFEKKGGMKETVACPAGAELGGIPLVVWVNTGTMGPAELVAGILQEIGKIKVIGLPTPGVAARTERFALKDESSIILTTAVFSLPSGRSLWGQGLEPDVALTPGDQSDNAYLAKTLPLLPKL
jgi:carboxyl-terminal processing protease